MNLLENAREKINSIDAQMAKLFEERMIAARDVAQYKKEKGMPIFDASREAQVVEKNSALVKDEDLRSFYVEFIKYNMKLSKEYQRQLLGGMKVAFCGVRGAFAQTAAMRIFEKSNTVPYASFNDAYKAVEDGECDVAVLPIENSYAGEVGQTIDLIFSGSLYINGIYELEIHQNLLGLMDATIDDIKKVTSHPQALSQCHDYIKLREFDTEESNNTAVAAKTVVDMNDKSLGAIASVETAEIYGLKVIEANINKSGENTTRFAVLSKVKADSPTLSNSVLMFTVKNEAGSLAKAISIIGKYGYNMTALRSRPLKKHSWQYYFYIEIDGTTQNENGQKMIEELSEICDKLKIAGTYAPHSEI